MYTCIYKQPLSLPIHNHKKQHVYSNWSTEGKFGEDIAKIPSLTITRLYQEVVVECGSDGIWVQVEVKRLGLPRVNEY